MGNLVYPPRDGESRRKLRTLAHKNRNMSCPFVEDEKCEGLSGLSIEDSELQGDDVCRIPRLYERCPTYQRKIRGEKIRV